MPQINNLSYTDTFKTWFDRTNTVISTVNGITVYNLQAGDGIGVTSSNGLFTINHGTNVATGVTFTGNVNFNGTVSFASSPTVSSMVVNVTPKITGITAGNVVRVNTTGLTLAQANTVQNAEVLGIAIGENASSHIVALSGVLNNSTFANTISNALNIPGATLFPNQAYFLDPVTAGGITTIEPTSLNLVSKPVLLGISGNLGAILPYRGQLIGLSSGASTASVGAKQVITLTADTDTQSNFTGNPINIGDLVCFFGDTSEGNLVYETNLGKDAFGITQKFGGKLNNSSFNCCGVYDGLYHGRLYFYPSNPEYIFGFVSGIISQTTDPVTGTITTILEITQPGSAFTVNINDLDQEFWNLVLTNGSGFYMFGGDGLSPYVTGSSIAPKLIDVVVTDANTISVYVYDTNYKLPFNISSYLASLNQLVIKPEYNTPLLLNQSLSVRQYQNSYLKTAGQKLDNWINPVIDGWYLTTSGITYDYLSVTPVNDSPVPAIDVIATYNNDPSMYPHPYLVTGNPTIAGITYTETLARLSRAMQPTIENIRKYSDIPHGDYKYISFTANGISAGSIPGVTLYGVTLDVYTTIYKGDTTSIIGITGELALARIAAKTTTRQTVYVPVGTSKIVGIVLPDINTPKQYQDSSVVFYTPSMYDGLTYTTASGWDARYTYHPENIWIGTAIAISSFPQQMKLRLSDFSMTPGTNGTSNYKIPKLTEKDYKACQTYYTRSYPYGLTTGNVDTTSLKEYNLQLGNLDGNRSFTIPFYTPLIKDPSGATLYSPFTGTINEAYNVNTGTNMANSGGLLKGLPWDKTGTRTSAASNNIQVTAFNKNGMVVRVNDGAESLDILKFHYVADGTFNGNYP